MILAECLRVFQVLPALLPALLEYVREEEGAWVHGAKAKHAEVPLQCGGLCNNTPAAVISLHTTRLKVTGIQ